VNTDYNREFLQKYNAGLWVQTGDLEGYVRKFMILYKDATLRKEMGANGRQAVLEDFHVSRVSEMFLKQITETWDK
jgi:glycosyltransferase involved in cell wall biosynthesis